LCKPPGQGDDGLSHMTLVAHERPVIILRSQQVSDHPFLQHLHASSTKRWQKARGLQGFKFLAGGADIVSKAREPIQKQEEHLEPVGMDRRTFRDEKSHRICRGDVTMDRTPMHQAACPVTERAKLWALLAACPLTLLLARAWGFCINAGCLSLPAVALRAKHS
jgi:hypothetical protein